MREIKFRMWDKETKAMYLQEQFAIAGNGLIVFAFDDTRLEKNTNGFSGYEHVRRKNSKKVELMQFTGLFDRNGKEIYESDLVEVEFPIFEKGTSKILEWGKEIGVVTWMPEYAAFWVKLAFESHELIDGEDIPTVVGNLYENPELLTTLSN